MMTKILDPFDSNTWTDDERRYFQHVDDAHARARDKVISNGRVEHAAYIIHKFLTHARRKVRIFSGKLSRTYNGFPVFGNDHIIDAARQILARPGTELTIVVEHGLDLESTEVAADHPVVRAAEDAKRAGRLHGVLEIRQASENEMNFLREKDFRNHWMVMDDHAYRLETNTAKAGAHVNFADRKTARALTMLFERFLYEPGENVITVRP